LTKTTTRALATLRRLAALGLPPSTVFGDLMTCLGELVPFETANIILLNDDYSPQDFLATFEMPPAASVRYAERWFNQEEAAFYPDHVRLQTDPRLKVMRVSDFTPRLGETEIYDEVLRHGEHHWIAGLTCRDGERPVGNLGLGRPPGFKDFTAEDLVLLDQARPYVSQALGACAGAPAAGEAGTVEVAMLNADLSGAVLSETGNAWRLLRWARDVPLDEPLLDRLVYDWARPLLAELAARVHLALRGGEAAPAVMRTANRYGAFVLRAYALTPACDDAAAGVGVQIERRLPTTLRLFRSPVFRGLANREQAVAQALVTGATYGEIAERMGVQPSTVVTHVRNLYARLRVGSREALAMSLLGAAGAGA
jgi:DNA-binding CsgD family transcriptional regulator